MLCFVFSRPGRTLAAFGLLLFTAGPAVLADTRIDDHYPIKEPNQISPPFVHQPIHECGTVVHVSGFVPHAKVEVFANGVELIGKADPPLGFTDIALTRALKLGETVTATQTVNGMTSVQSSPAVTVTPFPAGLGKPVVGKDLYQCGRIVPVDKLTESTRVHVFGDGVEIGSAAVAKPWTPVFTAALGAGQKVTARQLACEEEPSKLIKGPLSDPVIVKPEPSPLQPPVIDISKLIVGNDAVALSNLYVGAEVRVFDNGSAVGAGFATGAANWAPIAPPLSASSVVTADQTLCGVPSKPSDPGKPTGELKAPVVLAPICAGSQYAMVRETVVNANVALLRNGGVAGYGGAVPGDLVIALGGNAHWNTGDKVRAVQSMGSTLSPLSNEVTVVSKLGAPHVEVLGGEPFFLPESGEQAIDGPVFPRGRGDGPLVLIQACCEEGVKARVLGPDGAVVADLALQPLFPGAYTGRWDWTSKSGWKVPQEVPVGRYRVQVESGCGQEPAEAVFYVIFNPEDAGGPARFSFQETGVWFGTDTNKTLALVYYLHTDDRRVFDKAIQAASGLIDPAKAAAKVAAAEEALFGYSLDYHTNDVIKMLTSFSEAQCADDANVLTSMLRGIGIPAHPTTADAALETGAAGWTFDTWVEALLPKNGSNVWTIFHPHEGLGPDTRSGFGTNVGVATKSFNDLVVMAGESWVWSEVSDGSYDITFKRQGCGEPEQNHVSVASWLLDLCEDGYWNPNHWDCAAAASGASELSVDWQPDAVERFGGPLTGRLVVVHRGDKRFAGEVVVELVADRPESKVFPDRVLRYLSDRLSLEPGGRTELPLRFDIPGDVPPGHELYLRLRQDKRNLAIVPLAVVPALTATLEVRGEPAVGGELTVTARIASRSPSALERVEVRLTLPPGLELAETEAGAKSPYRQVQDGVRTLSLPTGEYRDLTWRLRLTAPLPAGSIFLDVTAPGNGWARAVAPVTVPGPGIPGGGDVPGALGERPVR